MRQLRLCTAMTLLALLGASSLEQGVIDTDSAKRSDDAGEEPIVHRLNLLSMMEGIGAGAVGDSTSKRVIDVGLHWKYASATATEKISAPKLEVGSPEASDALVHVEAATAKKAGLFRGLDDVEVEIVSRSKTPTLALTSGKGRWDVAVPSSDAFHVGKFGMKPTMKLADGKVGIATDSTPQSSFHIQSNSKGDQILFQGNFDGKTDALMDSIVTLESSADYRGRGVFMPHRGDGSAGASTAWFAGVPNGGGGFQIGSSASHLTESTSGPYTKKQAHVFVASDGKVAFGHTAPDGQMDLQVLAGNKEDADRAFNIRAGSINVDYGQGLNTARINALVGEKEFVRLGSAKKSEEREIRLQTDEKKYVTISRYNAFVGIGGVKTPTVPLDVKGNVKISEGQLTQTMEPKSQEQMIVLNSQSTVPAALGFRQADKPYMSISAGKAGGTIELTNGAALTVANGRVGIGTDPSELVHVKGGDMLLDGESRLWFKSKVSGTTIYEKDGLHLSGGLAGKLLLDDSDVVITNAGSNSKLTIESGPTKESTILFTSGAETWKAHTSMAGTGSLFFSNKGVRVAMTRSGQLGVGVEKPTESLHVSGSALMESTDKEVFASMKATAETLAAGVRISSGSDEWRVMSTGAGSTDVAPGSLEFAHGQKTHVVISKAGALGVGLGSPLAGTSLHVKGPAMYDVGKGKGKVVISTPDGDPGMSFFDNDGFRRMDIMAHAKGISFMHSAGKIGIGTRNPNSKLHLYDSKSTALTLSRSGKEASHGYLKYAGPYLKLGTATADGVQVDINNEPKLTVHPNGNVGLGTAMPQSQLQVGENSHVYQAGAFTVLSSNAFFDGAKYKYTTSGGAGAVQINKEGAVGIYTASAGSANMEVATFGKAHLSVTAKGFVGVATETPDTLLHIVPTEEATLKTHGGLMLGDKAKGNIVVDEKSILARDNGQASTLRLNPFGGVVSLFADSTKPGHVATFANDGNVGFGPAKPDAKLHVSEGPGRYTTIGIGESNAGIAVIRYKESMMTLGFSKSATSAANKEDAIVILKEGNVGVGTAAPKSKLHVQGNVDISGKLNVGGKQIVTMMEDLMKENQRLSMELAATKEMLMSMSSNLKRLSEMQTSKE